jgi:hypothetical protein
VLKKLYVFLKRKLPKLTSKMQVSFVNEPPGLVEECNHVTAGI